MTSLLNKIRLLWLALFSRQVPLAAKLLLVFGLIYGFAPFDLIPDILPLLGQLDDLSVLIGVFWIFYRAAAKIHSKEG